MNNLTRKQTDLIVSILNLIYEDMGYNIDKCGFGYDAKTLEIMVNEADLTEELDNCFTYLCNRIR